MVNFTLPLTINEMISISTSQNFRSLVVIFHLRQPMAFLSLNLYDTHGLTYRMNVLFWGPGDFPVSFSNRDTPWNAWNRHSWSLMVDTRILFSNMESPSKRMLNNILTLDQQWFANRLDISPFYDLDTSLTFTELKMVSMEYSQRVWHASRERLAFRTPGSVPLFACALIVEARFLELAMSLLDFLFEYPLVLSRFCFTMVLPRILRLCIVFTFIPKWKAYFQYPLVLSRFCFLKVHTYLDTVAYCLKVHTYLDTLAYCKKRKLTRNPHSYFHWTLVLSWHVFCCDTAIHRHMWRSMNHSPMQTNHQLK